MPTQDDGEDRLRLPRQSTSQTTPSVNAGKRKPYDPCSSGGNRTTGLVKFALIASKKAGEASGSGMICRGHRLCSGVLGLVSGNAGLWLKASAYNIALHHLSPRLISPRQQMDMPNDRRALCADREGLRLVPKTMSTQRMETGWPIHSQAGKEACGSGQMALTSFVLLSPGGIVLLCMELILLPFFNKPVKKSSWF